MVSAKNATVNWDNGLARRTRGAGKSGAIAAIMAQTESSDVIMFSGGFPNSELFASDVIADLTAKVLASGGATAMQYAPTRGLSSVRESIAEWLGARGDPQPDVDELMVTSGSMDAISLLAKSYLDPGDTVIVEAPTYLGAIMAFAGYEANVVGVPIDDEGLDVEALAALLSSGVRPKLLYTIPDFQNPTGLSLSGERRYALAELCRRYEVLIIEDVAYRELSFSNQRSPSLWSLAPDVVVQIGTFSKLFFPGVRLGWAAGPTIVIDAMIDAKQKFDQCAGALGQRLLEEYLRGGHMDRWLPVAQKFYERRARAMMAALTSSMPEGVTWTNPGGGFFTWLSVPPGTDTTALSSLAARAGITYVPGQLFDPRGEKKNEIRISFSCVDETQIDEGMKRLGALLTSHSSTN